MIERYSPPRVVQSSSRTDPVVLAEAKTSLGCGCHALAGVRLDTMQPVVVIRACTHAHDDLVGRATAALQAGLAGPWKGTEVPMLELALLCLEAATSGRTE